MRLSKIVTLLLAGFFTFGTLNSVAATKNAKKAHSYQALKYKQAVKKTQKKAKYQISKTANSLVEKHKNSARQPLQSGVASYYADKFNGRPTASGERFNNSALTAAHKTLPFGTLVEVTNLKNGKKVIVRINDRGPYAHARVIDLTKTAARHLDMHHAGVAKVKLAIVNKNKKTTEVINDEG